MSTTRKVLTIIFSILIVGAFAFVLTWGIINWSKVKEGMAGNGLYTQDDVQKSYEDGYSTAPEEVRSLGFGAGMGLPNMKKYSDEMKIDSTVNVGTTVTMTVRLS